VGGERAKAKAVKPVDKKPPITPPITPPAPALFAPPLFGSPPGGNALAAVAAKPGPRGHVLLQEIDTIRQLVGRGKTRDKKPVKCVRVVFLDEATARIEKRPLLDVGAKVYFMGTEGELVELVE
jgi:hypothetical protein